jgi:hypothetical protein
MVPHHRIGDDEPLPVSSRLMKLVVHGSCLVFIQKDGRPFEATLSVLAKPRQVGVKWSSRYIVDHLDIVVAADFAHESALVARQPSAVGCPGEEPESVAVGLVCHDRVARTRVEPTRLISLPHSVG